MIELGTLGGSYSQANDLNASGHVVGASTLASGTMHAFLWHDGILTDLGTLGADFSNALAINDAGQVAGHSMTGDGTDHGFLLTPEDTDGNGRPDRWFRDGNADGRNDLMLDMGPSTIATDVNNAGRVAGTHADRPFVWQGGVMTDLATLPGSYSSSASAINDVGQVTGTALMLDGSRSPFLWQSGTTYALGSTRAANDINRSGQVAGVAESYGTLWTPTTPNGTTGSVRSLGVLPPSGPYYGNDVYMGSYSTATGVNDSGTVVGDSRDMYVYGDPDGGYSYEIARSFVWADGVMQELPLTDVTAINNAGQIVGNDSSIAWAKRAFLLRPASDTTPTVSIGDVTIVEGNSGARTASFAVTLSASSNRTVTVNYATLDGTAAAGIDYRAASGTLSFAPGETSKVTSVSITGDRIAEPDETFSVNLSGATNATVADGQALGTIADDEPQISISDVGRAEGRRGKTTLFSFTVSLSAAYDQPVIVSYRTADGTAKTSDGDYVAKSGTLTFLPGETTKTITIEVKGDSTREGEESFFVDLFGNTTNSLLRKRRGTGWILNDD